MRSIKSLTQPLSSALLLLSAGLLVYACEKQAAAPLQPSAPVSVQVVSGDLQSGPPGKELPNPLVVKVVDANGLPQSGQLVNFRVTSGGGSVFAGAALTSLSGIAQERWTLGTNPADSQRVEARAVDNVTGQALTDRKSTRLNSSHLVISYAVFCLKKKNKQRLKKRYSAISLHI